MDIHILEGNKLKDNIWEYKVVFHIPITTPNPSVTDSSFKSEVPDITATELADIQAGNIQEVVKTYRYNTNTPYTDFHAMIKSEHTKLETEVNNEYSYKYKFYLTKLAKPVQKVI